MKNLKTIFSIFTSLLFLAAVVGVISTAWAKTIALSSGGDLEITYENVPLFTEKNLVPGDTVSRWVKIKNVSAFDTAIYLSAEDKSTPSTILSNVLILKIECGGGQVYNGTLANLFTLTDLTAAPLLGTLSAGDLLTCTLTVAFDKTADNPYQGLTTTTDFIFGFETGPTPTPAPGKTLGVKEEKGEVLGVTVLPQTGGNLVLLSLLGLVILGTGLILKRNSARPH